MLWFCWRRRYSRRIPAGASYGGDAGGTRYSHLKQITRDNVAQLRAAWTYHTGALKPETELNQKAAFEATPILVDGTLYLQHAVQPGDRARSRRPAPRNGSTIPQVESLARLFGSHLARRGRLDAMPKLPTIAPCKLRIFEGTIDARLIALDGKTGKPCDGFGAAGTVDLTRGVDYGPEFRGDYQVTSAPTVVGRPGDHRLFHRRQRRSGYAARRGARIRRAHRRIALDLGPDPLGRKAEGAHRRRQRMVHHSRPIPTRDLVFIPTGSASPDYYGGARPGDNRWANSVVALKASTGAFVWGFQVVHHDLWDYDVASQPALIEFRGKPAVAVTTKIGNVFVLDRETGKPLHTVEERAVPKSDIAGEDAAASQPIPAWSAMVPQKLDRRRCLGATPEMRKWCREKIAVLPQRRPVHAAELSRHALRFPATSAA